MTEVLYDESSFPEFAEKMKRDRRGAIETLLGGVAAYVILVTGMAFLVFPNDPLQSKVLGALILLAIPAFLGVYSVVGHWLNRTRPRRVTGEAIINPLLRTPLANVLEVAWLGPKDGVEITLDPARHRRKKLRIGGMSLIRPEEFLQALEGRVLITRKEPRPD